jgi:hypothetical protein
MYSTDSTFCPCHVRTNVSTTTFCTGKKEHPQPPDSFVLTCCQFKFFDPWIQNKTKKNKTRMLTNRYK